MNCLIPSGSSSGRCCPLPCGGGSGWTTEGSSTESCGSSAPGRPGGMCPSGMGHDGRSDLAVELRRGRGARQSDQDAQAPNVRPGWLPTPPEASPVVVTDSGDITEVEPEPENRQHWYMRLGGVDGASCSMFMRNDIAPSAPRRRRTSPREAAMRPQGVLRGVPIPWHQATDLAQESVWRTTATTATFSEAVLENEEVVPVNAVSTWVLLSGVTVGR